MHMFSLPPSGSDLLMLPAPQTHCGAASCALKAWIVTKHALDLGGMAAVGPGCRLPAAYVHESDPQELQIKVRAQRWGLGRRKAIHGAEKRPRRHPEASARDQLCSNAARVHL